jgi:hypothetical protein
MLSIVARYRRINRSVELIVQPGAKDAVGEMGVHGGWPRGRKAGGDAAPTEKTGRAARTCSVERAEIHVEALYFPSPVMRTPEVYYPLCAVAQHPTGINMRLTEGLGKREREEQYPTDRARSLQIYLAVGQPAGQVAHHIPVRSLSSGVRMLVYDLAGFAAPSLALVNWIA